MNFCQIYIDSIRNYFILQKRQEGIENVKAPTMITIVPKQAIPSAVIYP